MKKGSTVKGKQDSGVYYRATKQKEYILAKSIH